MKKITQQSVAAFYSVSLTTIHETNKFVIWKGSNTEVRQILHISGQSYVAELWLHGSLIAKRSIDGLFINPQGYTITTKERLEWFNQCPYSTENSLWYLNGIIMTPTAWTKV